MLELLLRAKCILCEGWREIVLRGMIDYPLANRDLEAYGWRDTTATLREIDPHVKDGYRVEKRSGWVCPECLNKARYPSISMEG